MTPTSIKKFNLLINGKLIPSASGECFDSINPSSAEVYAHIANATLNDMKEAIKSARIAFEHGTWPKLSIKERGKYLIRIAELIRENAKELAEIECLDVGKTIKHTTFIDVPTCADTFEYFGNISKELDAKVNPVKAPVKSITVHEPRGVIGIIIPWNYPLIMSGWKLAPALIAGNTIVFKPSSTACASVMRLSELIEYVGIPKGAVNIVSTNNREVAAELIKSFDVDMISFTGGTETGKEVLKLATANTKKVSVELGGKSPNIVFADCNMEAALGGAMSAIFMNQGQMCTAGSRLLLEDKIYDAFLGKLIEKTKKLKIGNAFDYSTDFGPVVSKQHLNHILNYFQKAKDEGTKIVCGGKIAKVEGLNGFFIEPTIFADVNNKMSVAQEEIFGPVLSVIKFTKIDQAIEIANDSKFGLASCIWTKDLKKADAVAKELKAGMVWINTYGGFYNEAPFGGYKQSGFGRELGVEGLLEYTQSKHICVDQTPGGIPLAASWF